MTPVEVQLMGLAGATCVLVAYAAVHLGWQPSSAPRVMVANIIGGMLLVATAALQQSLGFLLLNICWVIIGLVGLVRYWRARGTSVGGAIDAHRSVEHVRAERRLALLADAYLSADFADPQSPDTVVLKFALPAGTVVSANLNETLDRAAT